MFKLKKRLVIGIAAAAVLGASTFAFASPQVQQIIGTLKPDVKIMFNNEELQAKDANGQRVYPVIINGTTYLPVRAVADAFKTNVEWEGSTQTVWLGSREKQPVRLIDLPSSQGSGAFKINPTVDKNILTLETGDVIKEKTTYKFGLYSDDITDNYNKFITKLDKKYTSLSFKAYCINSNNNTVELVVKDKDKDIDLFRKKFKTGEIDTQELDVTNVGTLQIEFKTEFTDVSKGHKFLVIEPTLK